MIDEQMNRSYLKNIFFPKTKTLSVFVIIAILCAVDIFAAKKIFARCKRKIFCTMPALLMLTSALISTAAAKEEIIVSAAASLTQAMQAVGKVYEADQKQDVVTFNFAASGALLQQLAHGAPVDVFLSANQAFMDQAAAKGLIREPSRRDFVRNNLVLGVAGHAVANVRRLNDLTLPNVQRIAIGHPDTVPAGRYARQALTAEAIWKVINTKLIICNSVRQVLDYIRRGEVDAGLVYATDARMAGDSVFVATAVSTQDPIVYCLAITTDCRRERAARHFVEFILSSKGQNVLAKFGFQKIEF